ncbi:MAG: hypothetical protein EA415_06820 [Sphaerobacteraceae bacterium]|nr:MAG: hypothetical protein EA415_06820 [Sphaerobacteraceae bacterium]
MLLWSVLGITLFCVIIVLGRYIKIGRIAAGIGWSMALLAAGGFGSGIAASFTWSGFVFLFLGTAGVLIVVQDEVFRRNRRRQQP